LDSYWDDPTEKHAQAHRAAYLGSQSQGASQNPKKYKFELNKLWLKTMTYEKTKRWEILVEFFQKVLDRTPKGILSTYVRSKSVYLRSKHCSCQTDVTAFFLMMETYYKRGYHLLDKPWILKICEMVKDHSPDLTYLNENFGTVLHYLAEIPTFGNNQSSSADREPYVAGTCGGNWVTHKLHLPYWSLDAYVDSDFVNFLLDNVKNYNIPIMEYTVDGVEIKKSPFSLALDSRHYRFLTFLVDHKDFNLDDLMGDEQRLKSLFFN
jgi:hypothetical protein